MMSNTWDEEEDLTVVEEKETPSAPSPVEAEDETVAFARRSNLFPRDSRRKAYEQADSPFSQPNPFDGVRFPLNAALPRDRFAAFFVDSVILIYLFLFINTLLSNQIFTQSWFANVNFRWPFVLPLTTCTIGFLLLLVYYVSFEALAAATPGKFLCRLRVVDLDGSMPTLANVFLRNLCRLFDYPLFFAVAILSMESSRFYQRLGDRAARTVVIKKTRHKVFKVDLRGITLASTFVRAFAFFLDLLFFGTFLWFYLSSLRPQSPSFSWLSALFPLVALAYFMIFEILVSSTPGKIILKRQSILETGEELDNSAAILRNLLRPLDFFLAYFFLALSRRKQRLGDYVAETLVIKREPEKKAAIALGALFVIIVCLIFTASRNPDKKWFHQSLNFSLLLPSVSKPVNANRDIAPAASPIPKISMPTRPRTSARPQSDNTSMKMTDFYFSAGPDPTQIRSDGSFKSGDLIFAFFKLNGFKKSASGEVQLVEDIQIEAPNGELVIDKSNVVEFSKTLEASTQNILFANQVILNMNPMSGSYKMIVIVRDLNSNSQAVFDKTFSLQ